jgi:hypothetical protein
MHYGQAAYHLPEKSAGALKLQKELAFPAQ